MFCSLRSKVGQRYRAAQHTHKEQEWLVRRMDVWYDIGEIFRHYGCKHCPCAHIKKPEHTCLAYSSRRAATGMHWPCPAREQNIAEHLRTDTPQRAVDGTSANPCLHEARSCNVVLNDTRRCEQKLGLSFVLYNALAASALCNHSNAQWNA